MRIVIAGVLMGVSSSAWAGYGGTPASPFEQLDVPSIVASVRAAAMNDPASIPAKAVPQAGKGRVIFSPAQTKTFVNSNCEASRSCDLRRFSIRRYEYVVNVDGYGTPNFGTTVFFEYVTKSPKALEDYAFVNFIRGCQFYTTYKDGKVSRYYTILINSFGRVIPYRFPEWSIDSIDVNPMYNNSPEEGGSAGIPMHGSYRWNRVADSFDPKTEVLLADERPTQGRLYVSDRPGQAFVDDDGARAYNISTQFRTCIYPTRDIPRSTTPDDVNFAAPIACHEWASSYVYDFRMKQMTHPQELDCGAPASEAQGSGLIDASKIVD